MNDGQSNGGDSANLTLIVVVVILTLMTIGLAILVTILIFTRNGKTACHTTFTCGGSTEVETNLELEATTGENGGQGQASLYADIPSEVLEAYVNNTVWKAVDDSSKLMISQRLVKEEDLRIITEIGAGEFGRVYKGELRRDSSCLTVVVKTLRAPHHATTRDIQEFISEATIMKDFSHPNVLSLLGIIIDGDNPRVILPYMEHGSAKDFVKDKTRKLKVCDLLDLGLQIARGMDYLARRHFVHRDLAARNCMVGENMNTKIADFGLARDIYHSDYYRVMNMSCPLPVKWMARECIIEKTFTTKSDVWSYGVLMWELITRGCPPYPNVEKRQLVQHILDGNKLAKPRYASDQVYTLMAKCWGDDPHQRPTFEDIIADLSGILGNIQNNEIDSSLTESELYLEIDVPVLAFQ